MKTNDRPLTDLMEAVDTGAAQLPDFSKGLGVGRWAHSKR